MNRSKYEQINTLYFSNFVLVKQYYYYILYYYYIETEEMSKSQLSLGNSALKTTNSALKTKELGFSANQGNISRETSV